jgi:uncharacterized membrane protein YkgB
MIYFYYITDNNAIVIQYKKQLDPELQKTYEKISKERRNISLYGYVLGFFLSLFIILYNIKLKGKKMNTKSLVCTVMASCFLTNYFYYILSPKSDWMLNHINNSKQSKAWLVMYRTMSYNYHLGIVLGIIAVGILGFAFRE